MITMGALLGKTEKGFTLIETLVAITVLLLVIIGPITVAQKGIQNAYYANEQLTAVFLAQEAIEGVREMRDEAALDAYPSSSNTDTWTAWYGTNGSALPSGCTTGTGCAFDITDGRLEVCDGSTNYNCRLRYNSATGRYSYAAGGVESPFTRRVYIGNSVTNGGVSVEVRVTWSGKIFGGSTRTVKLQTWIYDQYQRFE